MSVGIKEKKEFLSWLVETVRFQRREVYWIINYLVNHETILRQIKFVEHVDKTPRGLKLTASDQEEESLVLFVGEHQFTNPEQIFHDIRMNWKKDLFVECQFSEAWSSPAYLAVLEDNPFASWNDHVDQEVSEALEDYIDSERKEYEITELYHQIDLALEKNDRGAFAELSELLQLRLEAERLKEQPQNS